MPELPEVETIRRYLHNTIVGKEISRIEVFNANSFIGDAAIVVGKKIIDTYRKGKVLNICLDDGTFLSVHLKMSGQLLENGTPGNYTRIIIHFTDATHLIFNDMRKFGWIKHVPKMEGTDAPDVTRPEYTLDYFSQLVQSSKKPIKTLLMDQDKIAGVGNIYANDALFTAKVLPMRIANSLAKDEITLLYQSVKDTIAEGIQHMGSSASDVYISPDGSPGSYQNHFKVYSREGEPCRVCGTPILREKQAGRSSFYCPHCQN